LRQMGVGEGLTQYLAPGQTSDPIQQYIGLRKSAFDRFTEYVPIGFDHIVPRGIDHILFVFGLFLLSLKTSALLWQISAFTLAHTVTLIAGALGLINVQASIVEPLIAASIIFVAVENIFFSKLNKWRTFLVFSFGLLHGLGFASVLSEFGLPEGQFLPALIGFNIGVEIGQLSVIAIAYLLLGLTFGQKPYYRTVISIPASCIIAVVGTWWMFERILLF
jgi:hydrogenase/urease accessory protein HupE